MSINDNVPFSMELEKWLKNDRPKTLKELNNVFGEKTFAIGLLILLAPSALPIPTGGVTNVLEIIAIILAAEMIIGQKTIWLPKFLLRREISHSLKDKAIPYFIKKIRWAEKYSRPRLGGFINGPGILNLLGLIIFIFILGAFFAVPFSGLDTLPSLGVVLISLGLILEDSLLTLFGIIAGSVGIGLMLSLSGAVFLFVRNIFF